MPIPVFLHALNSSVSKCDIEEGVVLPNYREGSVIPPLYRKGSVIRPNFREGSVIPPNYREGTVTPTTNITIITKIAMTLSP